MIEKILFNVIAFSLFINIFLLKLVKKNDTTYLYIIIIEAIGIAINFISILFDIWNRHIYKNNNVFICNYNTYNGNNIRKKWYKLFRKFKYTN